MSLRRQQLGKSGEDRAVHELQQRGYAILARRYRTRHGEIDIVARDGDVTVFVEVRARGAGEQGTAAESVTAFKQHRLVRIASDYAARHGLVDRPCRFDVVAIDAAPGGREAVTIYRNAFEANGSWG